MIAEHEWIAGWCKHCGASEAGYVATISTGGTSTCLQRPEAPASDMRPEPSRRQFAIESFDEIGLRLKELQILKDNPPIGLEEGGVDV